MAVIIVIVYLAWALGFRSHPVQNDPVLTGAGMALYGLIAVAVLSAYFIYSATREESFPAE